MDSILVDSDDIMSLSRLIRPPGGLKRLIVGDEHMQPDCVELLLNTVLSPSSLRTLALCYMKMDGTSLSFSLLKNNCNLTTLEMATCTIGSQDISCIAEVLCSNTTLEELWLGTVAMDEMFTDNYSTTVMVTSDTNEVNTNSAVRNLADALKVNQSLKILSLTILTLHDRTYNSALGEEGARALIGALQCNQTLNELCLPDSDRFFSPEELAAVDSRVTRIHKIDD